MIIRSQNLLKKYIKKKPFIIAELSANHGGSINIAKQLISLAKKSGVDAVKLQTFNPSLITVNSNVFSPFLKISSTNFFKLEEDFTGDF